jgi:hypothetical protein
MTILEEDSRLHAQDEVIAFLRRPESYALDESAAVETAETHISIVFLTGECAYKLKRALSRFLKAGSAAGGVRG